MWASTKEAVACVAVTTNVIKVAGCGQVSTKEAMVCVAVKTIVVKVSRTFARIRHRRLVAWWGTTSIHSNHACIM